MVSEEKVYFTNEERRVYQERIAGLSEECRNNKKEIQVLTEELQKEKRERTDLERELNNYLGSTKEELKNQVDSLKTAVSIVEEKGAALWEEQITEKEVKTSEELKEKIDILIDPSLKVRVFSMLMQIITSILVFIAQVRILILKNVCEQRIKYYQRQRDKMVMRVNLVFQGFEGESAATLEPEADPYQQEKGGLRLVESFFKIQRALYEKKAVQMNHLFERRQQEYQKEKEELKKQVNLLTQEQIALQEQIERDKNDIKAEKENTGKIQQSFEKLVEEQEQVIRSHDEKVQEKNREIQERDIRISELLREIESINGEIEKKDVKIRQQEERIQKTEQQISELNKKIKSLEWETERAKKKAEKLESVVCVIGIIAFLGILTAILIYLNT